MEKGSQSCFILKELNDNNYWSGNDRRLLFDISRKLKEERTLRIGGSIE